MTAAFILLAGAGLLIRSFYRVMDVDTGYDTEGIVAAYLPLPNERDPEPAALTQYIQQVLEEVRAVPGVQDSAVATAIPLRGWGDGMPFRMPEKPDEIVGTGFKIVTPGYFRTLGLRLVSGRLLDERDTAGSVPVVVVNESFVRRYLPNRESDRQPNPGRADPPSRRGLGPHDRVGNRGRRRRRESQRAGESHRRRRLRQLRAESRRRPRTRRERQRRSGDAHQIDSAGRAAREQVSRCSIAR